jgi:uracil-DNA glycosylase
MINTRGPLTAIYDLNASWKDVLVDEFNKPYMECLFSFLLSEIDKGKIIYPPISNWFEALKRTSFNDVSVVILGQDPYHGEGQAHGLSFSVKPEIAIPASLRNIFKELVEDTGVSEPSHGCLTSWTKQGILLLNTIFTVEKSIPGSHKNRGWEIFTNKIIEELNSRKKNLVFILWGKDAQKKTTLIDSSKHFILTAPHPSPLSSYKGFFGCKHFSLAEKYIYENCKKKINWNISLETD